MNGGGFSFWPTPLLVPRIPTLSTLGPARERLSISSVHPWKNGWIPRAEFSGGGREWGRVLLRFPVHSQRLCLALLYPCLRSCWRTQSRFSAYLSAVYTSDSHYTDCAETATASERGRRGRGSPDPTQATIAGRSGWGILPLVLIVGLTKTAMRGPKTLSGFSCLFTP